MIFSRRYGSIALVLALCAVCHSLAPAQRPAAQPRTTELTVRTEPGASVWVDGILFGKAGSDGVIRIRPAAGQGRSVRVRALGFAEVTKPVGAASEIKVPLTKVTDPAEIAYQEAERMLSRDRDKAAEAYRNAIKLRANYPAAYIGLARVLTESGKHEAALKTIRDIRRIAPQNPEASAVEGRILKETGFEDEAVAAFKRSISQGRGFQPEAYTGLGLLYKERAEMAGSGGDFAAEESSYNEAARNLATALKQLSTAPDAIVLYQLLGLVFEKQKKYVEAIRLYNEFLERFPDSNEAPAVRSFIEQIRKQMP